MAELIQKTDTLNEGREKLNEAIKDAGKAKIDSSEALDTANTALDNSESTQTQLDNIVIDGDSSVEAAQARVDEKGQSHTTLKERIDGGFTKVASQLAETGNYIVSYERLENESDGAYINRIISTLHNSGINNLTLEHSHIYDIAETIYIPNNFKLDVNNAMLSYASDVNINCVVIGTRAAMKNYRIKIFNGDFDKSAITFLEQGRIEHNNIDSGTIEGWWDGQLKGNGVLLYARNPRDAYTYNSFDDCRITSFEYGIKIAITKQLTADNLGAWINANRFNRIRFANNKHDIYIDGDFWREDFKAETSGNLFTNLELQLGAKTINAIHSTGNMNYFQGVVWDEGHTTSSARTIIADKNVQNNVFDFPYLQLGKQSIDTTRNIVKNYRYDYGDPTNFNRMGIPYAVDNHTFNGNQDDYLAYATKRFNVRSLDGTILPNNLERMFEPDGRPAYWSGLAPNQNIKFEIISNYEDSEIMNGISILGIVFDQLPSFIKITAMTMDGFARTMIETDNVTQPYYLSSRPLAGQIKKIVVEMNANSYGNMGITRLFAVNYSGSGHTYIRKGGDVVFGDIEFPEGSGVILRDPTGARRRLVFNDDGTISAPKI